MNAPVIDTVQWRAAVPLMLVSLLPCTPFAHAGIVFSALRQATWSIYIQPDLTSAPKPIEEAIPGDASAPALAPDGRRVALEKQGQGVYVCERGPSSTCQLIRLKRGSAVRPAWHPRTNELLFVRYLTGGAHEDSDFMITRDALKTTSIFIEQTGIQDYPDFSPDGRFLAYTVSSTISLHRNGMQVVQQLWLMDLGSGRGRQLLMSNARDLQPDWSPSGQELAFASDRTGQYEIWVVRSDGTGLRQVTSGLGAKTWPAWSPDGRSIMFTQVKDGQHGLRIIGPDGSNDRPFKPFGSKSNIELRDADWR